jgi:MFS family permease
LDSRGFPSGFWLYMVAMALIGSGYADFALIAYHFGKTAVVSAPLIPILYAVAMGSEAIAALVLGYFYDRRGIVVVAIAASVAAFSSPFVFLSGGAGILFGTLLWGLGMGAQESVMRAVVASMTSSDRRGTAFGILNAVFGIAWFAGSVLLGIIYDHSVFAVASISLILQLLALPLLIMTSKMLRYR